MENRPTKQIHISKVKAGDCVLCRDGIIRTITNEWIKRGGFMGTTIWGDSYTSGRELVTIVIYEGCSNVR